MKKLVSILLVVSVFLFSSAFSIYVHGQSQPRIWVVNSQGNGDFTNIQSAMNAANSGDTIFVRSGTYATPSTISKSLILYGENSKTTILSSQITISTNNFTLSGFTVPFIWVQYCNGTIINNVITEIRVINSSENVFENSVLNGLGFDWSHKNIVYNNTISGNSLRGIGASYDCSSNIIANNTITGNVNGILASISGSKFYHNVISGNGVQATIQNNLANTWDDGYPSGGNYWGNYQGTDVNHDGIGDTPYVIDSNNIDNYPFMSPSLISSTAPLTTPLPTPSIPPTPTPTPTPTPISTLSPTSTPTTPTATPTAAPSPTTPPTSSPTPSPTSQSIDYGLVSIIALVGIFSILTTIVVNRQKNKRESKKQQTRAQQAERAKAEKERGEQEQKQREKAEQERKQREEQAKREQDGKRRPTQPNTSSNNPYEVLGVLRNATENQVKDAWRILCKKYHPDTVKDKEPRVQELFSQEFDRINNAYEEIKKYKGWN